MWCLYVARNMNKCPLARGVRLREVSLSGDSTVPTFFLLGTVIEIFQPMKGAREREQRGKGKAVGDECTTPELVSVS